MLGQESLSSAVCRPLFMAFLGQTVEVQDGWMGGEGCLQKWRPGLGPQVGWGQGKGCRLSHHLSIYLERLNARGRQAGGDWGETSLKNVSLAGHPVLPRARPGSASSHFC